MTGRRRSLAIGAVLVVAALFGLHLVTRPAPPPDFAETRAGFTASEGYLLDRHGAVIQEWRSDFKTRRLDWVSLDHISPALPAALVAAEDRRFWSHGGIDWRASAAAIRSSLAGGRKRGASTITMQLAAMLDPGLRASAGRRGLLIKIRQARAARTIEARWTKPQILEAYVNLLGYRGELQGIAAAARFLLGKTPSGLDDIDSLMLAALLPAPAATADKVAARACALARTLSAPPDCASITRETRAVMSGGGRERGQGLAVSLAPQLAAQVALKPGMRITTTLDRAIQSETRDALARRLRDLQHLNVRDGAAIVVDNASGDILAYVGSAGPASRAPRVDGLRARRQAGSTLKPFLYGLAIERRFVTAASLLDDAPINLETLTGLYIPQNYDQDFKGLVSVRTALGNSLNIPAVRTLVLTGVEPFRERLNAMGFAGIREDGDYYGYSLALGSAEVTLLEEAAAYRALARGGLAGTIRFLPDAPRGADRRVMDAGAAFIITDILSDPAARALTFGTASSLTTPFWTAVKTGTSKAMRDNWCIGFSDRYTVGVWVGNFEGDSMRGVSGVTGAGLIWHDIMSYLHRDRKSQKPPVPQGVRARPVRFEAGLDSARTEWFLAGTETERVRVAAPTAAAPEIASPPNGAVIALDPDIPDDFQKVPFRLRGPVGDLVLMLDNQPLGPAGGEIRWTPVAGQHELVLADKAGRRIDSVRFTVR